jgi:hypothetical protein
VGPLPPTAPPRPDKLSGGSIPSIPLARRSGAVGRPHACRSCLARNSLTAPGTHRPARSGPAPDEHDKPAVQRRGDCDNAPQRAQGPLFPWDRAIAEQ